MKPVIVELIYEGDHCIPCVYMLETVEEAMKGFEGQVELELVYLRQEEGGKRYKALSVIIGKPAPIPSIFLDGKLYFEITPMVEELQDAFKEILAAGD